MDEEHNFIPLFPCNCFPSAILFVSPNVRGHFMLPLTDAGLYSTTVSACAVAKAFTNS
jgi:hypothetical protein